MTKEKKLTHIAGTFLIQADASFLNGAGLGQGEDKNMTIPKTFSDGQNKVPYVSSQSWKRWLRDTLSEENPNWPANPLRAIGWNPKGNVKKLTSALNPIDFPDDDIFGYMQAEAGQGQRIVEEDDETDDSEEESNSGRVKAVIRASPFMASLLYSIQSEGWKGEDEGFVHLKNYDAEKLAEEEINRFLDINGIKKDKKKNIWSRLEEFNQKFKDKKINTDEIKKLIKENDLNALRNILSSKTDKEIPFVKNPTSPVPYKTRFFNTDLQAIFCLNYGRLGVYWNIGDRIELEESKAKKAHQEEKIKDITNEEPYKTLSENGKLGKVYKITDKVSITPKDRASALFKSLAVLRGGAKQAQFGTDVAPKVLILGGLNCGNPIFNHLFEDSDKGPTLNIETFKEVIKDYADRIVTPVIVGLRSGYLSNEDKIKELDKKKIEEKVEILVMTPLEAANKIEEFI